MKHKFISIVMSALLAVGVLGAFAGDAFAISHGGCSDAGTVARFAGSYKDRGVTSIQGVTSYIDPDTGFHRCDGPTPTDPLGGGASSAWIAIVTDGPSTQQILQIGVIDCNDNITGYCSNGQGPGTYHFFWAYGGCDNYTPYARDLGVADLNDHLYKIQLSSGTYNLYIDGILKAQIAKSSVPIACWDGGAINMQYNGERHDYNDGLGTSVDPNTHFTSMEYLSGSSWVSIGTPNCYWHDTGSFCNTGGSGDQSIWTAL